MKSRTVCPCCHSAARAAKMSACLGTPSTSVGLIAAASEMPGWQIAPPCELPPVCLAFHTA